MINRCICGFMPNLHKKSSMVSIGQSSNRLLYWAVMRGYYFACPSPSLLAFLPELYYYLLVYYHTTYPSNFMHPCSGFIFCTKDKYLLYHLSNSTYGVSSFKLSPGRQLIQFHKFNYSFDNVQITLLIFLLIRKDTTAKKYLSGHGQVINAKSLHIKPLKARFKTVMSL